MLKILTKTTEGRLTHYSIAAGDRTYRIVVDDDGGWSCECKSSKFRGTCKHVLAIRMNREIMKIYPKLMEDCVKPTPVNEILFMRLIELPRYILHMRYKIRATVAFGRDVFLNGTKTDDLSFLTPQQEKLAGTIIDVVKDDGDMSWKVQDCYLFKGEDYRGLPLIKRLSKVETVVAMLKSPYVVEAPMETDALLKKGVYRWSGGGVVLKDLGSFINARPRNWFYVR